VFVRDDAGARVLDPKRSLRRHARTDFERIKPKWFIPVVDPRSRLAGSAGYASPAPR
jgi:hypothetical protein